jgi:ferredoxin
MMGRWALLIDQAECSTEPATEDGGAMKAAVDSDRCQGHARCWQICPEFFSLDEEGHSFLQSPDVPPALEAKVREAADNCPERAISVT